MKNQSLKKPSFPPLLATHEQTKNCVGRHACDRRPNYPLGFLSDVVSSYQVWFLSVHFAGDMAEKPFRGTTNCTK